MKQRILLAGIISCVLFGLVVFGVLSLRSSAFAARETIKPLSDPKWTGTMELVLRQTRDGGWALIPVTMSTINQLFGSDYLSSGIKALSDPSPETVKSTRFPPAVELSPGGVALAVQDGASLWLRTVEPGDRDGFISLFRSREFVSMYSGGAVYLSWDWIKNPLKLYEMLSISTDMQILDICESPSDPLIVAVLLDNRSRSVTIRFFDARTRIPIGPDLLLADADPRMDGGYGMLRGWTPDGQWVVMTSRDPGDNQLNGSDPFERIWVVSLEHAGIAPPQRKPTK
jgi:hypothetical protein